MSTLRRDKRRERYSRNTEGLNAQGFFSPSTATIVDGATQTPLSALLNADAAALAGVIGVYDAAGTLLTAEPAAGTVIKIAQLNSEGNLKKSIELVKGNYSVTKTAGATPVVQVDTVFPLNISIVGGLQEFTLSVRETTPGNQPFPVMEGRAIVRGGSPTQYDIATAIAKDISNSYDFERNSDNAFALVDITSDEAGLPLGTAVGTVSGTKGTNYIVAANIDDATTNAALSVGDGFRLGTAVTDPVYRVIAIDTTANTATLDRNLNEAVSGADTAFERIASAALLASEISFVVTGVDELVHFDTAVSEDLGDAVIAHTADWKMGSGAAFQIAAMEDECAVFDGFTTGNEAFASDYGMPDLYVNDSSTTDQYALYVIESLNRIIPSAGAPNNQTLMQSVILIAAIEGSGLETDLDAVFGV